MKQVLIISGKGGTGKTTIAAGFASLAENVVLADCDVDAPDLHIILKPEIKEETPFYALSVAVKDDEKCIKCGKCREVCRFNAIDEYFNIAEYACEGCAACVFICPADAIDMRKNAAGKIYVSETRFGPFIHAKLDIGQEASGKLVIEVKKKAGKKAEKENKKLVLLDGSPGIGCPVIASLAGVDLAVIVTEPTVSGLHDLERIANVTKHFNIPAVVCINKYDINKKKTREIEEFCNRKKIPVLGKIHYNQDVTEAMIALESVIEYGSATSEEIKKMWSKILEIIKV